MDKYIVSKITQKEYVKLRYPEYFALEIKPFIDEQFIKNNKWIERILQEHHENFNEKRKIGENSHLICTIIREDLIDAFINYINQTNLSLQYIIGTSIYETNTHLLKNESNFSLIEYAAFFGSIKIFKYLYKKGFKLEPSLWIYAIHSNNIEILKLLKKSLAEQTDKSYINFYEKSIKCHHNEIANYIKNNYLKNVNLLKYFSTHFLKYYNFAFIEDGIINESYFYDLCQFDYWYFVNFLLKEKSIDINKLVINEK